MSDLSFQQIPEQRQIQSQDKRKQELELILGHLVRMRCECQNLQYAVQSEDFSSMMDRTVTDLRYCGVILEQKISEVSP